MGDETWVRFLFQAKDLSSRLGGLAFGGPRIRSRLSGNFALPLKNGGVFYYGGRPDYCGEESGRDSRKPGGVENSKKPAVGWKGRS